MSRFTKTRFLAIAKSRSKRHQFVDDYTGANLAAQLRALREDRGLSQHEMAKLSGIAQPTISECETPERCSHVTIATLLRFAAFFDVALIIRFVGWPTFVALLPDGNVVDVPPAFAGDLPKLA
jgi:transcriptional regulator with XRE-family HTH domain